MNMGYVGGGSSTAITSTEKEFVVETLLYDAAFKFVTQQTLLFLS